MMTKNLTILGSTGSIGRQTLEVVEQLPVRVAALTAGQNVERMAEQCRRFRPQLAVMGTEEAAQRLREALAGEKIEIRSGMDGLIAAAEHPLADTVVTAVVGMLGLRPTLAAIRAKKRIALANKETLVCAGELVMREAAAAGAEIVPVDSEHSAIFQCLMGCRDRSEIRRLILTCSGGPFFGKTPDKLRQVTKADERLDVTSICMLPKGLQRLSLACHCDPLVLSRAIASLDGMQDVPGLNMVFDEMKRARPSSITAPAYYEAKVTEAAAMLLDWSLANARGAASAIRAADRSALNLTRAHIREHLDRAVPSSELCRIACMSASKLTRLFKQAEGMTPQEYARTLRMERACELLGDTDLSMAEIAARLGFARQGSFSEAFKERFGATPQEFRALRAARRSAR